MSVDTSEPPLDSAPALVGVSEEQRSQLPSLSPSRAADFKTCPLLYRFRTIDRIPEPRSVPYLIDMLHYPHTQRAAVGALGRKADKRATPYLLKVLDHLKNRRRASQGPPFALGLHTLLQKIEVHGQGISPNHVHRRVDLVESQRRRIALGDELRRADVANQQRRRRLLAHDRVGVGQVGSA